MLSQQDIEAAHGEVLPHALLPFFIPVLLNSTCFDENVAVISDTFQTYDIDKSGEIDPWELREALQKLGFNPSNEELFNMLAQVDQVIPVPVICPFRHVCIF